MVSFCVSDPSTVVSPSPSLMKIFHYFIWVSIEKVNYEKVNNSKLNLTILTILRRELNWSGFWIETVGIQGTLYSSIKGSGTYGEWLPLPDDFEGDMENLGSLDFRITTFRVLHRKTSRENSINDLGRFLSRDKREKFSSVRKPGSRG